MFDVLLYIHIAAGTVGLLVGLWVMLTKKGTLRHKQAGNVFFVSLLSASVVALVMSVMHTSHFLFVVGIFTAFMLLSGRRALRIQSPEHVTSYDRLLTFTMLLFGLIFIFMGIRLLMNDKIFGVVMIVFGFISLTFVRTDYLHFKGKLTMRNAGLLIHIQRMVGSYIASATAFLVVNNTFLPSVVAWLLPTAVLTPLIVYWCRQHAIKKA